jgi:asparagine synthase (glutamine-hydrolysing)
VLVHLYEEHGVEMPEYLEGMFVFSIWDSNSETLFLCRDRIGIKPLYIYQADDQLIWGSEMAAILAADVDVCVDPESLYRYFSFHHTLHPNTIVDSVQKLPPGHSLTVHHGDKVQRQYWELDPTQTNASFDDLASCVRDMLEESVRKRLMGDVPVGAFLSGGLDSSAIVALMSQETDNIRTFSIGFQDETIDESAKARTVAETFGTEHTELTVDLSDMSTFADVVQQFGEPLADPAMLPTAILANRASEDLKVVMTGEGADELFGGYTRYRRLARDEPTLSRTPGPLLDAARCVRNYTDRYDTHFRYLASFKNPETATIEAKRRYQPDPNRYLEDIPEDDFADVKDTIDGQPSAMKKLETFDIKYHLPDRLLYKVDHTTMAASLEARVPFLDRELVELAASIPADIKLNGRYKPILRAAIKDLVPDQTLERTKQGFNVPIDEWFRQDHDGITQWFTEDKITRTPYLSVDSVLDTYDEHRQGNADNRVLLWKYLNYIAWYHTHLIGL